MNLVAARSAVMAKLTRCPVCGSALQEAEKSENLEFVTFECEAAFFLQTGGIIAVSRLCASPTHVAVRQLEAQAMAMATEGVPPAAWPLSDANDPGTAVSAFPTCPCCGAAPRSGMDSGDPSRVTFSCGSHVHRSPDEMSFQLGLECLPRPVAPFDIVIRDAKAYAALADEIGDALAKEAL